MVHIRIIWFQAVVIIICEGKSWHLVDTSHHRHLSNSLFLCIQYNNMWCCTTGVLRVKCSSCQLRSEVEGEEGMQAEINTWLCDRFGIHKAKWFIVKYIYWALHQMGSTDRFFSGEMIVFYNIRRDWSSSRIHRAETSSFLSAWQELYFVVWNYKTATYTLCSSLSVHWVPIVDKRQ